MAPVQGSYYWARFEKIESGIFRFDTRIYPEAIAELSQSDKCIGAIVGKNPGSAKGSAPTISTLQPIELNHDSLLPNVRSVMRKANETADKTIPPRSYVRVLNLYYLCEPKLNFAITAMDHYSKDHPCPSENERYSWVWYMWGGKDEKLSKHKTRFARLKAGRHFFYDNHAKDMRSYAPSKQCFARHIQGLKHDLVVPYIAGIL